MGKFKVTGSPGTYTPSGGMCLGGAFGAPPGLRRYLLELMLKLSAVKVFEVRDFFTCLVESQLLTRELRA